MKKSALQLRKISVRRPSDEGCAMSHRHKLGPLPPNDVSKVAHHVRKGKEGKSKGRIREYDDRLTHIYTG